MDTEPDSRSSYSREQSSSHLFSLGERSFVKPFTNTMLLSPVQLQAHLGKILKNRLPVSCLADFLHEVTHHWCFHSHTGTTLALLRLRAMKNWFTLLLEEGTSSEEVDNFDILDDFIRYEVLSSLLQPLSEGLALFAEFDVEPTSLSPNVSEPLFWAGYIFLSDESAKELKQLPAELLPTQFWEVFSAQLKGIRLTHQGFAERKGDLLLQPIHCNAGGYLPGYLTVKNAWLEACWACSQYIDTDLFLRYMRDYFYNDLGLVACALNPYTSDMGAAREISDYFWKRFQSFTQNLKEKIAAYDQLETRYRGNNYSGSEASNLRTNSLWWDPDEVPNLGTDQLQWKLGSERLHAARAELTGSSPKGTGHSTSAMGPSNWFSNLNVHNQWLIAQRQLMRIGHMDVFVSVTETGRVVVKKEKKDDQPLLIGPARSKTYANRQGTGSLDVFIAQALRYFVFAVRLEDDFLLTYFRHLQDLSLSEQQALEEEFLRYGKIMNSNQEYDDETVFLELLKAYLFQDNEANSYILDVCRKGLNCDLNYGRYALSFVPKEDVADQLLGEMNKDGFLPILSNDNDVVRAVELTKGLALISLFAVCKLNFQGCEKVFQAMQSSLRLQGNLGDIVEEIQRRTLAKLGVSLIQEREECYSCYV